MPKYISGRSKKTPQSALPADRYRYLSVGDAEPNLGDSPSVQGSPDLPAGQQYIVVSFIDRPGERFWIPNQGGIIPGSLSVFEEGTLVGGLSSTTQLNFVGQSITAAGFGTGTSNPGVAVTVTVAPPGNENEVLFVGAGGTDFATDTRFTFNNGLFAAGDRITVGTGGTVITTTGIGSVGIGTTTPTQKLHLNGDFRITGTIYDSLNQPGDTGNLIVKTATGGLSWVAERSVRSGAGGTIGQIQYHNTAGLVDGASNFYFDFNNNRVGIGSTQPTQLLDVLGVSRFTGDVNFIGDNYNLLWDKSQNSLEFKDETKAIFGDGRDLQILHTDSLSSQTDSNGDSIVDGRTSLIEENGSGGLIFKSNGGDGPGAYQFFDQNWQPLLKLHGGTNAKALLFHNGVERVETTGYGVTINGGLVVSGIATLQTLNVQNLSVPGISTLGNVIFDSNTISTKSGTGNLILDSDGSVQINDPLLVSGATESTSKDSGSIITEGGIGVEKSVFIGLNLDVDGNTELDTLNVSIASTTASLTVGTGVAVTTILDEDNMSSDSATALATQQSIKAYVDNQITNEDLDFAGDSGSGSVDLDSQTFTIAGTTNEIETSGSNQTLTIGLPDNVTVSGNLLVGGNTSLGNDTAGDTVSFGSRVISDINPKADDGVNLGLVNLRWKNVYATTFNGAFQGTADIAKKLETPRIISFSEDVVAVGKTFDGTQNVGFALTLTNSGVTPGTYGSSTQVGIVTVDSKGRVTAASNVNINFADATVDIAKKLETPRTFTLGEGNSDDIVAIAKTFDGTQNVGFALTLKDVGPGAGTYGGNNKLISLALDEKGRVTGVTSTSINFGIANVSTADSLTDSRTIAATGDIAWSVNFKGHENVSGVATLSDTGVSDGNYGSATQVATFGVDTDGRLTAAGNVNINFAGATVGIASYADNAGIATNLKGGGAYQIPYQSAANTTQFIPNGSVTGQLLQYNQSSAPSWVSVGNISAGTASTANNLSGGAAGSIPYQTNPGITAFLAEPDADNKILSYDNSSNAPVWINASGVGTDNYVDEVSFSNNTLTLGRTGALSGLSTTISLAGLGGTDKFTGLTDTPANYNSAGGKVVTVNSSEDGLEFTTASTIGTDNYVDGVSFAGNTLTLSRTGALSGLSTTIDVSGVGTSYTLVASGNPSAATITLTGSDSTTDPVTITAGAGITFGSISAGGFTIAATATGIGSTGSGGIELLSPKTATGTSVEFTDIPADAKEITLMFSEVGISDDTNHLLVQLGTSSGWINTGYYASSEAENGNTDVSASDGFPIHNKNSSDSAGNRFTGSMIINLFKTSPSKTYTQIGQFKRYNSSNDCEDCSSACQTYGNVDSISGDITRIRVLANHTGSGQSFTNGEINVSCNSGGSGGGGSSSGPVGTIVVWAGSVASIPSEYQLCDGAAADTPELAAITGTNVPDLRDRFIIGATDGGDGTYPGIGVGSTGGSADAVVVEHAHTMRVVGTSGSGPGGVRDAGQWQSGSYDTLNEGESGTNKNLPPYYALCYIIKHTATSGSGGGSGGDSGIGTIFVKQYANDNNPRTEYSCSNPINVITSAGITTIGIGSTSNAFGKRYVGTTEPTSDVCDGDIWYDTGSGSGGGSGGGNIPSGGIIIWSGASNLIGSTASGGTGTGWVLCDGSNNTPDLRNRFVVGASDSTGDNTYPGLSPNATPGGSADAAVISHTHGMTHTHGAGSYDTSAGGGHQHTSAYSRPFWDSENEGFSGWAYSNNDSASGSENIGNSIGDHTHSVSGTSGAASSSNTGGASGGVSATNRNLPPYYALCYIMKT